jgi:hypothetical protein
LISRFSWLSPSAIGPGLHALDVFFVDINQVQAGLTFSVDNTDVTVTPPGGGGGSTTTGVPEPGTPALFSLALGGMGLMHRRRRPS